MVQVSVVIPTFGRPQLLKRAVDSVLAQTMADLECIVVIDGQDPATVEYLEGVGDPRLRHIAHAARRGAGQTRDTGADAAAGAWVAFLDDDDEWLPEKLERQLAVAPADARAVVMTLSHVVTPEGSFVRPLAPYDGARPVDEWLFDRTTWWKGGLTFLQTSSLMAPKAMFDTLHFRDTRQHEEWELVIRAVKEHGYRLLTAPEPLVIHYAGQQRPSLSKTYTWRASLEWADGMRALLTPRAYAGFLLAHVGQNSANVGEYSALLPLVRHAFAKGRPTGKQLLRFALGFAIPRGLRRRTRAALQGQRPPATARAA
jgi:glycosyltransferase involved in cell wall biosynthesis